MSNNLLDSYKDLNAVALIAPAGYGKTEEIVNAVRNLSGKFLILTHTNAGVSALKNRMKKKKVPNSKYVICTIASYCIKWCKSYPCIANVNVAKISDEYIQQCYKGAKLIFSKKWAKDVISITYNGIFIDEYQDCSCLQHDVFMQLTSVVPIRIFGDPLQSIFYWISDDKIVDWENIPFPKLSILNVPWRWKNTNVDLGRFLHKLRDMLLPALKGSEVVLNLKNSDKYLNVVSESEWNNGAFAYRVKGYKNILYIAQDENRQKRFSKNSGGLFQYDEKQDLSEIQDLMLEIKNHKGIEKAKCFIELLRSCANGINREFASIIKRLENDSWDFSRISKHREFADLLLLIIENGSINDIYNALLWIRKSKIKIYRKQLFSRLIRICKIIMDNHVSIEESLDILSSNERYTTNKYIYNYISSRTVLVKGFEYECVIVDCRSKMDVRDFYVALTRATKFVYVISNSQTITFDGL